MLTSCTWSCVAVRAARHVRVGHRQRRVRRQVPVGGGPAPRDHLRAERGDHRAVVRAQPGPRHPQPDAGVARSAPAASARSRELAATPPPIIRWSTPSSLQARTALRVSTSTTASWKDAATSAHRHLLARRPLRLDPAGDGRLQAGEGEVVRRRRAGRSARAGRRSPSGRPRARCRSMTGPPGKPRLQHPGDLVEGLARRVVDGRAQRPYVGGDVGGQQQRGVAAADQQRHRRLGQRRRAPAGRRRCARRGG